MKTFYFLLISFSCLILTPYCAISQLPNLKFEHIGSTQGLPQSTIHGIAKDKYGFMWFGTWAGLCRYDGYEFKVYKFQSGNNRSINSNRIHNILKDGNNQIWILTFKTGELCRYNYERDDFDRVPFEKVSDKFLKLINRFQHYTTVNVLFGGYKWFLDYEKNALCRVQVSTGDSLFYTSNPANKWSLTDKYVVDIYKDDQNIFWAGTYSNGINKANLNAKPFEYFFHDPANPNSINDNNVRAICEDHQGRIWIGTWDNGLSIVDKGKYTHIKLRVADSTKLSHNQIKTIFCDSRGIIWIGTKAGLVRYSPSTKVFTYFDAKFVLHIDGNRIQSGVYGITEDHNGIIWFAASYLGVCSYSPSDDRFEIDYLRTPGSFAKVILIDKGGRIWVGSEGHGLSIFTYTGGKLELLRSFQSHEHGKSFNDDRVTSLYEDKSGLIWIGTGNGLAYYNPVRNTISHFSPNSELSQMTAAGIIEDDSGNLWISHKGGISNFNKNTLQTRKYTMADGLQGNEFSDNLAYKSPYSNKFYFGGNNGFTCFKPEKIIRDNTLPKTVLTELALQNKKVEIGEKIQGRILLNKPLHLTKDLTLEYEDKIFAIKFSALHFANPMINKYAYMLEGFDKDWIYTNADRRIASYSNLKPGKYTFKVISSNADGIWNKTPAVLNISVSPPIWESAWAYCAYFLIIVLAALIYHHHSTNYAALKSKLAYEKLVHEKENELHQSKVQFFTNISHEIKTPLTLILAPLERLMYNFSDNVQVYSQLMTMKLSSERLFKLVNQLLDFRRLETGHLHLDLADSDIIPFLRRSILFFADEASNRSIRFEFEHSIQSFVFKYDEDKLDKVISNLLTNAMKFTSPGHWIKLNFQILENDEEQSAIIGVSNLGAGISEDEEELIFRPFCQSAGHSAGGTGLGLAYCKGLVELHGGTIKMTSKLVCESMYVTTFSVKIPFSTSKEPGEINSITGPTMGSDLSDHLIPTDTSFQSHTDVGNRKIEINSRTPVLLIVEDNVDLRSYLINHFLADYEVLDAENGRCGLEIARSQIPDLILSDVMMDDLDGFAFSRLLKGDIRTSHIPLILMTARNAADCEIEGLETGADDYISKPFRLSTLSARVRNLLLSRQAIKNKYRKEALLSPQETNPLSTDERMLQRLSQFIEDNLAASQLGVQEVCKGVGISKSNLYRKLKELTGLTLSEIIKEIRLRRAKQLLLEEKFSVNEIAYMVGFADADYFRKCFRAEFSMSPTQFAKGEVRA